MSELINNSEQRKELLKHLILELHSGGAPEQVRSRLKEILGGIPYGEVVEVEQELISEGISQKQIQEFCDIHSSVLDGHLDHSMAKLVPPGHPVDTFRKENEALALVTSRIMQLSERCEILPVEQISERVLQLRALFNELGDLDKHYRRKENLVFPYLEQRGITGPPTVMWGKHDEIRGILKSAREALAAAAAASPEELATIAARQLVPAARAVDDMIMKEDQILLPMCMDTLTELEWYEVHRQTQEIGFCLYDPRIEWTPKNIESQPASEVQGDAVRMPSGMLTPAELTAILNTVPFDLTFVDADDKVKYFSQGAERIFDRNRAILGRDVRLCHPPSSVNIVDKIIEDFRSGKEDRAPFWIQMRGMFIHIEYFAVRDAQGKYLGTLEVSENLTDKRALEGEQRLLSYGEKEINATPGPGFSIPIAPTAAPPATVDPRPDWADNNAITLRVDATAMLDQGANPLSAVMISLGRLLSGELLHMHAPFYPKPMVELLQAQGHAVWGEETAGGWAMWIRKA